MSTIPQLIIARATAGARYVAAVIELRAAFTDLSAIDRLCNAPSFGPPPDVIPLRHPTYAPDVGGSFTDDIAAAVVAHHR
jgi:hypothetical protein